MKMFTTIRIIALCICIVFTLNSIGDAMPVRQLAQPPYCEVLGTQKAITTPDIHPVLPQNTHIQSEEKYDIILKRLLQERKVLVADTSDMVTLLEEHNGKAMLVSDGKVLVHPDIVDSKSDLVRALIHEEIEALMQVMRLLRPSEYRAMKQKVLQIPDVVALYKEVILFEEEWEGNTELLFNDIIAYTFELLFLKQYNLKSYPDNFTFVEHAFLHEPASFIEAHKHSFFTRAFWDIEYRHTLLRNAYNEGIVFQAVLQRGRKETRELDRLGLMAAIEALPNEPSNYLRLGAIEFAARRYPNALRLFSTARRLAPKSVPTLYNLGLTYIRLGKYSLGITLLERAADLKKDSTMIDLAIVIARMRYGGHLFREEEYEKALFQFQKILETFPLETKALYSAARCYIGMEKFLEATLLLRHIVSIDANYSGAREVLDWLYMQASADFLKKRQESEAIHLFEEFAKDDPKSATLRFIIASFNTMIGEINQAEKMYLEAIALDPTYRAAHEALGLHYFEKKRFDLALSYLTQAVNLDTKNPEVYRALEVLYVEKGDSKRAQEYLERARQLRRAQAKDTKYLFFLGKISSLLAALFVFDALPAHAAENSFFSNDVFIIGTLIVIGIFMVAGSMLREKIHLFILAYRQREALRQVSDRWRERDKRLAYLTKMKDEGDVKGLMDALFSDEYEIRHRALRMLVELPVDESDGLIVGIELARFAGKISKLKASLAIGQIVQKKNEDIGRKIKNMYALDGKNASAKQQLFGYLNAKEPLVQFTAIDILKRDKNMSIETFYALTMFGQKNDDWRLRAMFEKAALYRLSNTYKRTQGIVNPDDEIMYDSIPATVAASRAEMIKRLFALGVISKADGMSIADSLERFNNYVAHNSIADIVRLMLEVDNHWSLDLFLQEYLINKDVNIIPVLLDVCEEESFYGIGTIIYVLKQHKKEALANLEKRLEVTSDIITRKGLSTLYDLLTAEKQKQPQRSFVDVRPAFDLVNMDQDITVRNALKETIAYLKSQKYFSLPGTIHHFFNSLSFIYISDMQRMLGQYYNGGTSISPVATYYSTWDGFRNRYLVLEATIMHEHVHRLLWYADLPEAVEDVIAGVIEMRYLLAETYTIDAQTGRVPGTTLQSVTAFLEKEKHISAPLQQMINRFSNYTGTDIEKMMAVFMPLAEMRNHESIELETTSILEYIERTEKMIFSERSLDTMIKNARATTLEHMNEYLKQAVLHSQEKKILVLDEPKIDAIGEDMIFSLLNTGIPVYVLKKRESANVLFSMHLGTQGVVYEEYMLVEDLSHAAKVVRGEHKEGILNIVSSKNLSLQEIRLPQTRLFSTEYAYDAFKNVSEKVSFELLILPYICFVDTQTLRNNYEGVNRLFLERGSIWRVNPEFVSTYAPELENAFGHVMESVQEALKESLRMRAIRIAA